MKSLPLIAVVLAIGCGDSGEDQVQDPGGKGGSSAAGSSGKAGGSSGSAGNASGGKGGSAGSASAGKGGGSGKGGSGGTDTGGKAGDGGTSGTSDGGSGDETGGTGGTNPTAGRGGSGGSGATAPRQDCSTPPEPGLPSGAPELEVNRWVDITPDGLPATGEQGGQGLAVDVCNPGILYYCAMREGGGVYKSMNGGGSWERLGGQNPDSDPDDLRVTRLTFPIRLRIDPSDSDHLYAGDGVEGTTGGWWRSFDGGNSWEMPQAYMDIDPEHGVYVNDVYDVAVDPSDFQHVLVTSHSDPFILESKDGGDSWIFHPPPDDIGSGHSIAFLYDPDNGIGNSNTWLLGTQTGSYLRTEDAGETWDRVSQLGIVHGGGNIYRARNGTVYATAETDVLFSTDNGASWDEFGLGFGASAVQGDGELVYTIPGYENGSVFYSAPEGDGEPFEEFSQQTISDGIFEMGFDPTNRIMYAGGWYQHVFAMKVP